MVEGLAECWPQLMPHWLCPEGQVAPRLASLWAASAEHLMQHQHLAHLNLLPAVDHQLAKQAVETVVHGSWQCQQSCLSPTLLKHLPTGQSMIERRRCQASEHGTFRPCFATPRPAHPRKKHNQIMTGWPRASKSIKLKWTKTTPMSPLVENKQAQFDSTRGFEQYAY